MLVLFLTTLLLTFLFTLTSSLTPDGLSLLALKSAISNDPTRSLDSWSESDSSPCHWPGVFCTRNRVTSLYLPNKHLSGYLPSELGRIDSLKRLSLSHNNFAKSIPAHLFNATNLQYIDLSHNAFTGNVPSQIKNLKNLTHLDLSSNLLNGSLPESLTELNMLTGVLNFSWNMFSGEVPPSYGRFPAKLSLDFRHNNLTGKIPQVGSLLNQGPTAFAGNEGLCGFPLETACPEAQDPHVVTTPDDPSDPDVKKPSLPSEREGERRKNGSMGILVISGVLVVCGVLCASVWLVWRIRKVGEGKIGKEEEKRGSVEIDEEEGGQKGKFVVLDEGFSLELEDLLRASAYVVGKSKSGILYRVVVGGRGSGAVGTMVAVRRLSEGDVMWKLKEFENEVEAIGKVQHPNIVRLRAYYYADDEKLLVTDFIKNGNLYNALHGGPSNSMPQLSWATRLKIAQGTARGLTYIHEYSPRKYVHGNVKSSKILLDEDLQPFISGFGITRLVSGASRFTTVGSKKMNLNNNIMSTTLGIKNPLSSNVYLAPEARVSGGKFTQKCDVYSFGIVLLEILTGQLPDAGPENDGKELEGFVRKVFREERPLSEVIDPAILHESHAKNQVIAAFHIALNCTEIDPELRPKMRTVSESLDRIKSH